MTILSTFVVIFVLVGCVYATCFKWKGGFTTQQNLILLLVCLPIAYLIWYIPFRYLAPPVEEITVVEQIARDDMNKYCQEQGGCMGMQEFKNLEEVIKSSN